MIHHTLGAVARRLAVIQVPRTPGRRLGSIRQAVPYVSFVTLGPSPVDTTDQWLAQQIAQQSAATDAEPGTLTYTPTIDNTPPPVARWNTWNGPCGSTPPPGASNIPSAVPAPEIAAATGGANDWLVLAGVLGAAASGLYLLRGGG